MQYCRLCQSQAVLIKRRPSPYPPCLIALSSASLWQSFLMADRCFLSDFAVYLGLAGAAFLAATILPAQSELGLAVLIQSQDYALIWLLVAASIGNIAGAVVNYMIGRGLYQFQKPDAPEKIATPKRTKPSSRFYNKAAQWYERYGKWSLLLSWMPFIGDPLTVIAGYMRLGVLPFTVIVSIAKITRYLVVAYLSIALLI